MTPSPSPTTDPLTQMPQSPDFGSVVTLILVLALMIGGAYYVTKIVAKRGGMAARLGAGSTSFTVLERLAVARDKSILLVQLHDAIYLIGVASSNISLLDKLTAEEASQMGVKLRTTEKRDSFATLGEFFKKTIGGKKTNEAERPSFKNAMDEFRADGFDVADNYESEPSEMTSDELDAMMLMMEKRRRKMNGLGD